MEAGRRHLIPSNYRSRLVSLHVRTLEKNLVLMQGKQVLLTTETSLQATTLGVETEFITGMWGSMMQLDSVICLSAASTPNPTQC